MVSGNCINSSSELGFENGVLFQNGGELKKKKKLVMRIGSGVPTANGTIGYL